MKRTLELGLAPGSRNTATPTMAAQVDAPTPVPTPPTDAVPLAPTLSNHPPAINPLPVFASSVETASALVVTRPAWANGSDVQSGIEDNDAPEPAATTMRQMESRLRMDSTDFLLPLPEPVPANDVRPIDHSAYDDPMAMQQLIAATLSAPELTTLSLSAVMPAQFRQWLPALRGCPLTHLQIEFAPCFISKQEARQLEQDLHELIAHHPSLTSLSVNAHELSRHLYGNEGSLSMRALLRSAVASPQLHSCSLLGFHLSSPNKALLPLDIDDNHPLKVLTLRYKVCPDSPEPDALLDGLTSLRTLVFLEAGDETDWFEHAADSVALLLAGHPFLTALSTAVAVAIPQRRNRQPPHLQLPEQLIAHPSLTALELFVNNRDFTSASSEHFRDLMQALLNRPQLEQLWIHCWDVEDGYEDDFIQPWLLLLEGLQGSTSIRELTLTGLPNAMTDQPNALLDACKRMLTNNRHLVSCTLSFLEPLPADEERALAELIVRTTTINQLMPTVVETGAAMSAATILGTTTTLIGSSEALPALPHEVTEQIAAAAFQMLEPVDAQHVRDAFRLS